MRLGESDDGNLPTSTTQRQAYDLIAAGLRAGHERSAARRGRSRPRAATAVLADISRRDRRRHPASRRCCRPQTSPHDGSRRADRRVPHHRARQRADDRPRAGSSASDVLPRAVGTQRCAGLRGRASPPRSSTSATGSADRLPYFIGAVVLLSFLLLMLVFHSVLVPLTAAVMNLLSVGAAYGATVAVFQWGWAKDSSGLESTVPIVLVRAHDDVRGAVRAVDGLPGVPAHADPRGVRRAPATPVRASCAASRAPRA